MAEPSQLQRRLLENHLRFTELHRGPVIRQPGLILWESEHEDFRCSLIESPEGLQRLAPTARAVRTFPWSGDVDASLEARGFRRGPRIRYMHRHADRPPPSTASGLTIWKAETVDEVQQFSDVQSGAFASPGESVEELRQFLHAANARNVQHPAQAFYVGELGGAAAATTLLLIHEGAAGIYAVATLPDHRRKGLSRALLSQAMADARASRCDVLTLQVVAESDAERLYAHLGFLVAFDCQLWSRS